MSLLDKLNNRTEGEKWSHPELIDVYNTMECIGNLMDTTLNTELPFEERKKQNDDMIATVKAMFPVKDETRCKRYDIPGCSEEPDAVSYATVTHPQKAGKKKLPCVIYIAGGGLTACMECSFDSIELSDRVNAVVVVCGYRTIYSGGGYPATINDVHAAFIWVLDHAEELGINPDKIVIHGASSGGHLSLALCHRLKRYQYHGHQPRGCIALVPICDERTIYPSSKRFISFGGPELYASSLAWLGDRQANSAMVPREAFANHATAKECVGLPPTFIHTTEHEVSVDSDMSYVSKLIQAGVYTDFHVWGGAGHSTLGYAVIPEDRGPYAQLYLDELTKQMTDCFKYDLRRSWIKNELEDGKQKGA